MTHAVNDHRDNAAALTVMSNKEAARFLGISHRTLEDWRMTGRGPKFVKLGRLVRYRLTDLLSFLDQNRFGNTGGVPVAA